MSNADSSDNGNGNGKAKRPSARRDKDKPDDKPAKAPRVAGAKAPRAPKVSSRAKPPKADATSNTELAGAPQPQTTVAEADLAQHELREVERNLDVLLGDVRKSDGDEGERERAVDAISQIATRLASDKGAVATEEDALLPKARQYLSTDYYLKQWGELGMRNRAERVDDFGLDRTYEASVRPFLELMANKYFRVEIEGVKNIPNKGRALLIGNHSGTLPWDGVMLRTALRQHHPVARELRWLVEDHVFHAPFLGAFINRIGAVRAHQENAQRLLESEELLAVFPEGIKGIAKRFADRY
jgi:hypothetical protein